MAKQKNNIENPENETQPTETAAQTAAAADETADDTADKEDGTEDGGVQIPPRVAQLLQKFPAYQVLYVDPHGGVYTPGTPAAIRGTAVRYDNPYYEPQTKR